MPRADHEALFLLPEDRAENFEHVEDPTDIAKKIPDEFKNLYKLTYRDRL